MRLVCGQFPSGYYGHFRSKSRNDFVCEYRQLARPQPPDKFLNRAKVSAGACGHSSWCGSVGLIVCPSICLSVSVSLFACFTVSVSLYVCLSLSVSVSISVCLSVSVCVSPSLPGSLSLSVSVPACLPACLPVCLSVSLSPKWRLTYGSVVNCSSAFVC